jgi:hypothetical protein
MNHAQIDALMHEVRGLRSDVRHLTETLFGNDEKLGVLAKVQMLWNTSMWIACTASAAVGSVVTWLVTQ